MITENERKWLLEREMDELYFCRHCDRKCIHCRIRGFCPTANSNFRDAAEFEERVAVKLANIHFGTEDCEFCGSHICVDEFCCDCHTASTSQYCLACRLKYARLTVEEEMENDQK